MRINSIVSLGVGLVMFITVSCQVVARTFLNGFPNEKPTQVLVDQRDRFFIDFGDDIYVFSWRIDYKISLRDPNHRYGGRRFFTVVNSRGTLYSIFESSYTPRKSKTTYYNIYLATCPGRDCKYRRLASYSITSGSGSTNTYSIESFDISKKNNIFYVLEHSHTIYIDGNESSVSDLIYYVNNKRIGTARKKSFLSGLFSDNSRETTEEAEVRFMNLYFQNFSSPSSGIKVLDKARFGSKYSKLDKTEFEINGKIVPSGHSSRYSRNVIWDRKDRPHIFFHDPRDQAFYHLCYSNEKQIPMEFVVDSPESGQENVVFESNTKIWSIHYFYRDSFNKGLLVTVSDFSGKIERQFILDASKTRNSGWDLIGGQSSRGRIFFSYLSDKHNNKREFIILNTVKGLNVLGKNLASYGNPKGKGYLKVAKKRKRRLIKELATSHLKEKKSLTLNFGAGVQSLSWNTSVETPKKESGVKSPYQPKYEFSDSLLNIFGIEGNYNGTNFGVEIVSKMLDEKVEREGSEGSKKLNQIRSQLGWEKLFFDFDVKLQAEKVTSTVFFKDLSGQVPAKIFEIDFKEIKLSLLTFKRHHFGLLYQTYNFYQPVYIYKINKGNTHYKFDSQAIGEIHATNVFVHYGYSTLDYLVKYETNINDWFLDGEIRGGLSMASFNGKVETTGGQTPSTEGTFGLSGQIEGGWIWYKRWENIAGAGGAIKLSYRINYARIGSSDKPKNRKNSATSDGYHFGFERTELKHGPIVFISLNY